MQYKMKYKRQMKQRMIDVAVSNEMCKQIDVVVQNEIKGLYILLLPEANIKCHEANCHECLEPESHVDVVKDCDWQ